MIVSSSILCALLVSAPQTFQADARVALPLILLNQGQQRLPLSALDMAAELDAAIKRDSRLTLELVSPDVVAAAVAAPPQPASDLFARLAHLAAPLTSRDLDGVLVLSYSGSADSEIQLSLIYLRPRAAIKDEGEGSDRSDARILEAHVPKACASLLDTLLSPIEAKGEAGLVDALRGAVPDRLRPCFEGEGLAPTFARAQLELPEEGFEVSIDGRVLGAAKDPTVVIEQIAKGERELRVQHPSFEPWSTQRQFVGGETIEFEVNPVDLRLRSIATTRSVVRWGAVGLGALGSALLVAGAAMAGSRSDAGCIELNAGTCNTDRYERVLGLPVLPVGLGLVTAGLIGGTAVYFDSPRRQPWLPIALGLLSGAAVTAAVWAVE